MSEFGVTNALRDGEGGDGDAGEEVVTEEVEVVLREPLEDGDEVTDYATPPLVFESPERVVGEKGFFAVGLEAFNEPARGTEVHLAHTRAA